MDAVTKPIRISPETHKDLKALAAHKGTKMAEEAEKAIQAHLRRQRKKIAS